MTELRVDLDPFPAREEGEGLFSEQLSDVSLWVYRRAVKSQISPTQAAGERVPVH